MYLSFVCLFFRGCRSYLTLRVWRPGLADMAIWLAAVREVSAPDLKQRCSKSFGRGEVFRGTA
ncbi:hypothetical protein LQZ19_16390 [Treponema primitia]|uniref:hypothetical protein n=1 Tax=Treponema primitia TaxID=88058 RepID=UPI0039803654